MRRLISASLVALLVAGVAPAGVIAAVPVADPVAVTTDEDAALEITLTGTDADLDPLTFAIVDSPAHGDLSGTAPDVTYTPDADFHGSDSFTFKVNDGTGDSAPATVSITVTDVNDAPSGRIDASGLYGFPYVLATTTTVLPVLANDSGGPGDAGANATLEVSGGTAGLLGGVAIGPSGGSLVYDPKGCATGSDVLSYEITDGGGLVDPSTTVAVTVVRPGSAGFPSTPVTDVPSVGLRKGGTLGRTVPIRVRWCGVVKGGSKVKAYRVQQSADAGTTWPTLVARATSATSATLSIARSKTYAWRVRTTDTALRRGRYRMSATARASVRQETPSTAVVYSGAWRTTTSSRASGGTLRSAASTSASVTVTVAAGTRQVGIVGPKGSGAGSFRVWVDGTYAGSFTEKASTASFRRIQFVRSLDPAVGHTIELRPAGNGRVYLDAIVSLR